MKKREKKFELVPHTADLKIRVFGSTKEELFAHALYGMFSAIEPCIIVSSAARNQPIECVNAPIHRDIALCASDEEALLVDFLSKALYLSDVHNEAYFDARVKIMHNCCMEATLCGVSINGFAIVEIKAVTYHDLAVIHRDGVWQATIVFDI